MDRKSRIISILTKGGHDADPGRAAKARIISRLLEIDPPITSGKGINDVLALLRSLHGKDLCIYRNLELLDLVVECAVRPYPIKCYGSDFNPSKLGTITVSGIDHPNPQWLIAALTHVDEPNMQILLSRVNVRSAKKFLSTRSLRTAVEGCIVFVSVSHDGRSVTLSNYSGHQTNLSAEDLLKPENVCLLQEIRTLQ